MSDSSFGRLGRRRGIPVVITVAALLLASAAGCASFPAGAASPGGAPAAGEAGRIVWKPIARGLELAEVVSTVPPLRVYCLKVDTGTPGVEVVVTPPVPGTLPALGEEYRGQRTSTFLERFGMTAAVNGSPFHPVRLNEGKPTDVAGVSISRGAEVSPPERSYDCLIQYPSGEFTVLSQSDLPAEVDLALGGFYRVLENGAPAGATEETVPVRHPRTGVGVSRSGLVLYLVVIDGRNPVSSIGATEYELAAWLAYFGSWEGINLDGGGSSTMALADAEGRARIVNHPLGYGILAMERVVGNHLGVIAESD